jgi:hypothetical protein
MLIPIIREVLDEQIAFLDRSKGVLDSPNTLRNKILLSKSITKNVFDNISMIF